MARTFRLEQPSDSEGNYFATDACPWGIGGVRFENHRPVEWFAAPLRDGDLRRFGASRGDSANNTTWEALAILVALRVWPPGTHVLVRVRSDSLSALRSLVRQSSRAPNLNAIAREVALDSALGLYVIGTATHIPGISNSLPDDLSRQWAPQPHAFPPELQGVPEAKVPPTDRAFWRAAGDPSRIK